MADVYLTYEAGVNELLSRLGSSHHRYTDTLVYQHRLLDNIAQARLYGDTDARRAERAQVIDALNRLALQNINASFNDLCGMAVGDSSSVSAYLRRVVQEFRQSATLAHRLRNPAEMYVSMECATQPDALVASRQSAVEFVQTGLNQSRAVLLLGNYGSGKSYLMNRLLLERAESCLRETTAQTQERIPLLYPLRRLRGSSPGLIFAELVEHLQARGFTELTPDELKQLLSEGRFLCILDGFDEIPLIALHPDPLRELERLRPLLDIERNQTIITSRPGVFAGSGQADSLRDLAIGHLMPWSDEQWTRYLRVCEQLGWDFPGGYHIFHDRVAARPQLFDLTRTPLYCHMLVETSDQVMQADSVNLGTLYTLYVDRYLQSNVEAGKGVIFDLRLKKECLMAAAVGMLENSKYQLTPEELSETLSLKLQHISHTTLRDFVLAQQDIQTYSLLVLDAAGNFAFSHKSFYEFFVAHQAYAQMTQRRGAERFGLLSRVSFTDEIIVFLADLLNLAGDASVWQEIKTAFTTSTPVRSLGLAEHNNVLLRNLALLCLAHEGRLEKAMLNSLNFTGANLAKRGLMGARLNHCVFLGADLTSADLRDAQLRTANLRRAILSQADLRDTDLTAADLHDIACQGTRFQGACFEDVLLRKSDVSRILSAIYQEQSADPDGFDEVWLEETRRTLTQCAVA